MQFAQVQLGLLQLRASSPQLQSTQVHGSHVHPGFSQVVAVLMTGSLLSWGSSGASRPAYALTQSKPVLIAFIS
ncbi:MAG TPA: hypothetical protein VEF71_10220 [Streptosporangiaceae bacterium]|nr:hypothetical protein [Streptosporangiaceae bacterium]